MIYYMNYADWCQALDVCEKKEKILKRGLAGCDCGPAPGFKIENRLYICCDLCYEKKPFFEQVSFNEFLNQNNLTNE